MRTFTARWILPVAGPPLERGTITVRGDLIEAVEPAGKRTPDEDLGDAVVIPGLVNAHTHLDLSGAAGLTIPVPGEPFPEWLKRVIAFRRSRVSEQAEADIRSGLAESLRHGVTLLGDISAGGASWPHLVQAPLRAVVFWELIGTTEERFMTAWLRALNGMVSQPNTAKCCWGRSPHAPYSVHKFGFQMPLRFAAPMAVHLSESQDEIDLLAYRGGTLAFEWSARFPGTMGMEIHESDAQLERDEHRRGAFVPFLRELGVWEPRGLIRYLSEVLNPHTDQKLLVVHGNYLPGDTQMSANQSLVICPRTHAAFGHPPHPFREFLQRGVRVCLGTDSLASNPDLDILAEARFVHAKYPDFPGDSLLKMITLFGAEALGWANESGSLEPGKSADFVSVPLLDRDAADPHVLLFSDHSGDRRTMFRGEWRL